MFHIAKLVGFVGITFAIVVGSACQKHGTPDKVGMTRCIELNDDAQNRWIVAQQRQLKDIEAQSAVLGRARVAVSKKGKLDIPRDAAICFEA